MEARKFHDNQGGQWVISLTVDTVKEVRNQLGFDLLAIDDQKNLTQLAGDMILLVDVLWLICESQAASRDISSKQFGERLVGDPIEQATSALLRALCDFFPSRRRAILLKSVEKVLAADEVWMTRMEREVESGLIDKMIAKGQEELEEKLAELTASGKSSGDSPA